MIASEMIGLAALILILIFFYTRMIFPKLRSLLILILSFASAGLVGYSSASSIGIGWTVSLAFLIFLGVAFSIIYLQKKEDQQIEQYFEHMIKAEEPMMATPTEAAIPASLPILAADVNLPMINGAAAVKNDSEEPDSPVVTPHSFSANETESDSHHLAEQSETSVTELLPEVEPITDAAEISSDLVLEADSESAADKVETGAAQEIAEAETTELLPDVEPVTDTAESLSDLILETDSESTADEVEAEAVPDVTAIELVDLPEEHTLISEQNVEVLTEVQPGKADSTILPEDRDRIQTLSAQAEKAIQQGDFLRAYQSLREALSINPPVMAAYILSRQLVQVLNEMGLYEESISVLEKALHDFPSLSAKKREEFSRQISYLEELIQQLQVENKRNLSWSLVPPAIHQKVIAHFRTLFAVSNSEHTPAIPFH